MTAMLGSRYGCAPRPRGAAGTQGNAEGSRRATAVWTGALSLLVALAPSTAIAADVTAAPDAKRPGDPAEGKTEVKPAGQTKGKTAALPADAGPPIDIEPIKDKLVVLTDDKRHYLALIPFGSPENPLYYGDGATFWLQRVSSGGSSGTEFFSRSFWEPRVESPSDAAVSFRDGKYLLECATRKTELHPLGSEAQKALLARAKFHGPRWKHQAYALARDMAGRYFYVDQPRDPEQSKRFRLFIGMKGSLKLERMSSVVSDSAGDVFVTRGGSLRLVLDKDKKQASWNEGAKKTELVVLPLQDNHVLVYTDLGVYAGERLGTPCDDL